MSESKRIQGDSYPDELAAWMTAAQAGDGAAYRRVLEESLAIVRRFLSGRVGDSGLEDVVQETLLSVHKARHTFQEGRPYLPWLLAIARRRAADYWRGIFREKKLNIEGFQNEPDLSSQGVIEDVREAVSRLKGRQAEVIRLLKMEGVSIKDAAKEMGMTEAAVKVTAHRAYKALGKILERTYENN